jgi:molybdate transport system substrate-binding protein
MSTVIRKVWRDCSLVALLLPAVVAPSRRSASRPTLTVFAAASLTAAFTELADTLERRTAGLKVALNFAGSPNLALQITQGAVADVFASADEQWMAVLRDSGFVADAPRVFAHNRLVLIVPTSNPGRIDQLQDLARRGVKLVVAAAAVPAGRYARAMLFNLSRLDGFPPDFGQRVLDNVVSNEDNVKAVVAKVQLGEADAGLVYTSDVTPDASRHVTRLAIPATANVIADYPVAVLKRAPNPDAARAFVDLLLSSVGQRVLQTNGFIPVGPTN